MTNKRSKRHSHPSYTRQAVRLLLGVLTLFLAGISTLAGVLLLLSRGKPKPFLDEHGRTLPGSISEKVFVTVNGVQQGMCIKSRDDTNPVLLYLHGGLPDYQVWLREEVEP